MPNGRLLATVALVVLSLSAGCAFVATDGPLYVDASPATVPEDAREETGYEETNASEVVVNRTVTVGDDERTVVVTNHLTQYERRVDLGPLGTRRAAVFAVLSSPEAEVFGETYNPIGDLSERELLEQFDSQYDSLSVGERVGNRTTTVLGQETTVEKFEGTAALAGTGAEVDVFVHVTRVRHQNDFVVVVAVYPQRLSGEESRVFTLLDELEHGNDDELLDPSLRQNR